MLVQPPNADAQHTDIPDGRSFLGVPRYYRHSLTVLQRAVRSWNAHNHKHPMTAAVAPSAFVSTSDRSLLAVQAVVAEFDRFLDAYDFNAVGWSRDHPMAAAAGRFLDKRNPNTDKNNPSGLAGVARRFVMFNGAVCEAQLRWLDGVLRGRCCGGKLRWCAGTCRYTSARHHCQG
ncbi:Os01g0258501 [Oryza sativa Japonica Group]|uniref:Os01g0258501 protein n=1 Tax=Oryza sativa subsp. japonica TaxID=39947 RepID=A0A0P0V0N9_ORYSJ|nr:Os01g0258501 [Oryza sativa Japonica Group]